MELIRLENVKKIYQTGEVITKAVDGIDFTVDQGEFALIIGASGAGKTTVLNILGGMILRPVALFILMEKISPNGIKNN